MKTNTRFIKGVIAAASNDKTIMPWARGARRVAFATKRLSAALARKSA